MAKNLISLKKLKRISIFLIIFLLCFTSINFSSFQKSSDNQDLAQIPEKIAIVNSNNPPPFSPTSVGNSKSMRNLYESNPHGGSWLDSFEGDSGIGYHYNLEHQSGDLFLARFKDIPNGNFEKGTLGKVPDNWGYDIYNTGSGSGTHTVNCNQINTQYYSISHSMYGQVKSQANSGSFRTHMNVSMSAFEDLSGGKCLYLYMRDIQVSHSLGWGWNAIIYLQFYDGVNKICSCNPANPDPGILYYNGESIGTANLYNATATGMDSQTWYVYKRDIPPAINMSNLNLTITWYADDWTGAGSYSEISSVVDKIYLETESIGFLISKPIDLEPNMKWNTLIINKTQPLNTYANVSILNATDNSTIPGSPVYVNDGEFDISYIDPVKYPSIRLRGNCVRNCTTTPVLHYWGVSWNATNAWRDSLFGGLKGTNHNLTFGDGEIWMSTSPNDWFKVSTNPIFTPSLSGWDSSAVHSPYVRFNGTGYTMWYSGRVTSSKMEIGVAFSSDGVTWTRYNGNPVLSTSTSGWENRFINYPCVLFDGNSYRMWYTGQDTSGDRRTGYATSSDGLNWQKYSGNPVIDLGPMGQWDDHYAHRPIVNYDGSIYTMWYIGLGGSTGKYQVGYATSYDGINWMRYPSNPIIPSPIGSPLGYGGTCSIFVLPYNNNYLGWYDYGIGAGPPGREIYQIYSNDGLNWITNFINPILKKGASGTWDDTTVVGPRVLFNGKQYLMYYTASDGTITQVGLAKTKFYNGTLYSESITIPSNKVWDRLIINKSQPYNTNLTISILDNSTNIPIKNYTNLKNFTINLSGLDPNIYSSIKLVAYLNSTDGKSSPTLFDWSVNWTYSNLIPIAEAGANQIIYENQVVILNGTSSYDPDGSIVNWSWDIDADGILDLFGPFANYTYNDDSVNNITLMVTDDQGANNTDYCVITVLNLNATIDNYNITILQAYPRTIGYWKHQCKIASPKGDHTGIKLEFITGINNNSSVFTSLTSKDDILGILEPEESKNMTAKAEQQLMGLWLNVVSGKLSKGTAINLTNLTNSTAVGAAIAEIELIILNTGSNRRELERAKNIADSINNGIGLITTVTLDLWASDAGSDDIILTIDWNDGSANTTITFFNNAPINSSDPFPSQFGGIAPMNVQAILIHKYDLLGTYLITIKLQDDDNSIFILKINLTN